MDPDLFPQVIYHGLGVASVVVWFGLWARQKREDSKRADEDRREFETRLIEEAKYRDWRNSFEEHVEICTAMEAVLERWSTPLNPPRS